MLERKTVCTLISPINLRQYCNVSGDVPSSSLFIFTLKKKMLVNHFRKAVCAFAFVHALYTVSYTAILYT